MKSDQTIMMLQMIASFKTEKECVNTAIESLTKYKEKNLKGGSPFSDIVILLTKWQQDGASLEEIMKKSIEDQEIVNKAIEIKNERIGETEETDNIIITSGEPGQA